MDYTLAVKSSRKCLQYIGVIQYICRMPSDLISLADASALLGVSAERVRQLVVAGDVPGVRFGNAWAVPRDAIVARRQASNRRGRPLGPKRVWQAIGAGDVDLSNPSRYRNRGEVHRYSMSAADGLHLVSHDLAVQSGVAAAIAHGVPLSLEQSETDLYIPAAMFAGLDALVAAVADDLGSVVLRVVRQEVWSLVHEASRFTDGRTVAPAAAVALDLMDSGDPRHWLAAERLVAGRG